MKCPTLVKTKRMPAPMAAAPRTSASRPVTRENVRTIRYGAVIKTSMMIGVVTNRFLQADSSVAVGERRPPVLQQNDKGDVVRHQQDRHPEGRYPVCSAHERRRPGGRGQYDRVGEV